MILTTTNSIDGYEIIKYLTPVHSSIVAGTNIFKDIFAEFGDVLGGKSKTYQNELSRINEDVLYSLEQKARKLGTDAIVGLRIENNEISGGGKQMLMVTASGTAVKIRKKINLKTINTDELINTYKIDNQEFYLRELESRGLTIEKISEVIENKKREEEEIIKTGFNSIDSKELIKIFENSDDESIKKELAQELVKRGYGYYARFLGNL